MKITISTSCSRTRVTSTTECEEKSACKTDKATHEPIRHLYLIKVLITVMLRVYSNLKIMCFLGLWSNL